MIYVGTCGYAYKEWAGPFYPSTIRQNEMLSYYAHCFGAVEIDASYYGVLTPETVATMNARTHPAFRFCFKVPQSVSHVPDASLDRVHPDGQAFVESLVPLAGSGKLGCALLQFPNGFGRTPATERYVCKAVESLRPLPVVVEFRNAQWQVSESLEMLCGLGAGWCNVDMPDGESLMRPSADVSSGLGYVRLHGRNASTWWSGNNRTRYDYDYSDDELQPWTARAVDIAGQAEETYVFFNNHARGNAARNARRFARLLCENYGPGVTPECSPPPRQASLFD